MYKAIRLVPALVLLVGIAACTKVSYQPLDPNQTYGASSELKIFHNYPDAPYEEIGTLRAVGPDKDKLLENIRARALKIGAQGLVVKPVAERTNSYEAQRLSKNLSKVEYIMEAVALRFKTPEK